MKILYLVRHAKAAPATAGMTDRDRPLEERGKHEAKQLGKHLHHDHVRIDRIVSSPAKRTFSTALILAHKLEHPEDVIVTDDRVYASDVQTLMGIIGETSDEIGSLMVVGHNPEFTQLANQLCNEIDDMPTCAMARFRFDVQSWGEVGHIAPVDAYLETP